METDKEIINLPHHNQLPLCSTRLPYRQGRKLTAVKVYTVNNESKHLLVFGVPSLNLRQEAKALFIKFGKLKQFVKSNEHQSEIFTETYHVVYERIQSARIAKKMLDTKNFYGGCLHICYAPELESQDEVRDKLHQRRRDVLYRLSVNNLEQTVEKKDTILTMEVKQNTQKTLNMGEINVIGPTKTFRDVSKNILKRKNNKCSNDNIKKSKSYFVEKAFQPNITESTVSVTQEESNNCQSEPILDTNKIPGNDINKSTYLNYNNFGNEIIRQYKKNVNKIRFHFKNKNL